MFGKLLSTVGIQTDINMIVFLKELTSLYLSILTEYEEREMT